MNRTKRPIFWLGFLAGILNVPLRASSFYDFPVNLNILSGPQILAAQALPIFSASSQENSSLSADLAFDGKTATRWSSSFSDPQWLAVDYRSVKTISQVTIQWETAYAKAYKIQISNDGSTWSDIYSTSQGAGGKETIRFSPVNARYLRMYGLQRATPYGYSIYEMAVTQAGSQTLASASSQESASYPPSYAIDGSLSTRWSSQFSDPQWLQLDLGNPKTLNKVTLNWEAAYAKAYQIQVSNDGASWTSVVTKTNGAGGQEVLSFPSVSTRFVRMLGTQRATPYGYSLYEMKVGTATTLLPSATLTAAPATITAGQSATLTWTSLSATSVSIDQGIGAVAATGSKLVSPAATTLYTLTATNSNGKATATAQVTVNSGIQGGRSLTLAPGREFTADSYVHKPLADNSELDPNSAAYVSNIVRQISKYYGVAAVNIDQYTPAIFIVPTGQATVRVKCWDKSNLNWSFQPLQDKWLDVPLPDNFAAASGTDKEAVVYQPSTGKVWEFWLMEKTGAKTVNSKGQTVDEWGARWGGRMDDISTNPGYFLTEGGDWYTLTGIKYGTTATSLPFLGGILTIQEQQNGVIDHVVGVALPEVLAYPKWSYPANRSDGSISAWDAIPEGMIFRLPANLNLDQMDMDPYARMIAKAVQKHGMVVWDRAGTVSFRAENPSNQYPEGDPYTKAGGILNCPGGISQQSCWGDSNGRLRGFPWDKLQALKARMNQ